MVVGPLAGRPPPPPPPFCDHADLAVNKTATARTKANNNRKRIKQLLRGQHNYSSNPPWLPFVRSKPHLHLPKQIANRRRRVRHEQCIGLVRGPDFLNRIQ